MVAVFLLSRSATCLLTVPVSHPRSLRSSSRTPLLMSSAASEGETTRRLGFRERIAKQINALKSKNKEDLASMGLTSFFSYGLVSNVNSVLLIAFTWASFRRANPAISPFNDAAILFNPLTWFPLKKAFLAFYVGYYATIGTVLRPFRFGLALALTPKLDQLYKSLQARLKVSKAVAILLVTLVVNIGASAALLFFSVYAFCFCLGVTPVP